MSDGEATGSRERRSVGVVAPEMDADGIAETVADAGVRVETGFADAADADAVVAVGDAAVRDLAAAGVSTPVLPVDAETVECVPFGGVRDALDRVLAGRCATENRPLVRVETPDGTGRAVFDVALSTAAPATISEFGVEAYDRTDRDSTDGTHVARFRADGVVVATPAGSRGYARDAGGPVVVPGSDVLSVVPVAPFATDPDHWVVPLSGVSVTVERDDAAVAVRLDGRDLCTVGAGATVCLVRDGALRTVVPDEGRE